MSVEAEHKINDTTKWGMLILALLFDGLQFITPGYTDTMVTLVAALVFGMIFMEKGALTMKGKGAMKIFKILIPISEVIISHVPGITLMVWLQIKISRLSDEALPEFAKDVLRAKNLSGRGKVLKDHLKSIKSESKRVKKYRSLDQKYGKGNRGKRTLERLEK